MKEVNPGNAHVTVWCADSPVLAKARFHRMQLGTLKISGLDLTNAWRVVVWVWEQENQGLRPILDGPVPERFRSVRLFHIRAGRVLEESSSVEAQGVANGDTFVLVRESDDLDGIRGVHSSPEVSRERASRIPEGQAGNLGQRHRSVH